jgi:ribosomal protein S18 acetylase RimI-like enzyme
VPELLRGLQERAARAQPAERVERRGGWWLRLAPSRSWWIGTAMPHGTATRGLGPRIAGVEAWYAGHGVPARFQVTPAACPEGLDVALAERGYARHDPISLQVATAARVLDQAPPEGPPVELARLPTPAWLDALTAVDGGDPAAERASLARVEQPSVYASARVGDDVVAVGRAVADTGWVGVFGVATLPQARGRGAARAVLAALAGWAGTQGADRLYLQVECDNAPALRLYERAGFAGVCTYHYRSAGR